jgi:hypothetical protein
VAMKCCNGINAAVNDAWTTKISSVDMDHDGDQDIFWTTR